MNATAKIAIVETGMTARSPQTPSSSQPPARSRPPPLPVIDRPSLSYFVPPPPVGWAVVGSYSAAAWHAVRALLAKREITARMGSPARESSDIEMLVPVANEIYARSLLAGEAPALARVEQSTGGFPVVVPDDPLPEESIPFATPIQPHLTPQQLLSYNIVLVFLWLALIAVSILTLLALFYRGGAFPGFAQSPGISVNGCPPGNSISGNNRVCVWYQIRIKA